MDQGETLERVNSCNDRNVQGGWQQAWPFNFPENLQFCRTIHTRCFYERIINISHSCDVEDDRLTNRGGQQDDNDGHQSPVFVPQPRNVLVDDMSRFQYKVQNP